MNFEEKFRLGSKRLKGWDYSHNGFYFITICSHDRENIFGEIKNDKMILNKFGKITKKYWCEIPTHFSKTKLDEFIVMPNHLHGIVIIDNVNLNCRNAINRVNEKNIRSVETLHATFLQKTKKQNFSQISPKSNSLSVIIRSFKSAVTKNIHQTQPALSRIWQNRFYDHIVRNENELNLVRNYIQLNPVRWSEDHENMK